jgi:hypothetical protein
MGKTHPSTLKHQPFFQELNLIKLIKMFLRAARQP